MVELEMFRMNRIAGQNRKRAFDFLQIIHRDTIFAMNRFLLGPSEMETVSFQSHRSREPFPIHSKRIIKQIGLGLIYRSGVFLHLIRRMQHNNSDPMTGRTASERSLKRDNEQNTAHNGSDSSHPFPSELTSPVTFGNVITLTIMTRKSRKKSGELSSPDLIDKNNLNGKRRDVISF